MAGKQYLPGTQAVIVYVDSYGISCSSIVDIVQLDVFKKDGWLAIKARKKVFEYVFNVTPIKTCEIDVEDGWAISAVSEDRLAPLGTRVFHIVH